MLFNVFQKKLLENIRKFSLETPLKEYILNLFADLIFATLLKTNLTTAIFRKHI